MTKRAFLAECPKTRAEFCAKWREDYKFRNHAKVQGFSVVCGNVIFPNGKVATPKVK